MLSIKNLCFKRESEVIFDNLSIDIKCSNIVRISGKNGVGKTTLLKIIAGILKYESGQIIYNNKKLKNYDNIVSYISHENFLAKYTKGKFINLWPFKSRNFIFDLTEIGSENKLSFGEYKKMMLNTLSVDIDKIWLLDEPFANLDRQSINTLLDKIDYFKSKKGIVIMTAHDDIGLKEDIKLAIKKGL